MKTIIEDYIENIVTNHMNIIRKNQCADLLLFCVDILINNSENNNYEKDLNHIICEILLLMKNSPERCAFLLKAGMDGGIREAAFAIKNLSEYSGELKNVNFSLNSYLLKTIDSKLKMISEYPLVFGLYDVVSGITGDLYYLLDCDDILSDTKSLLKIKEILNVIVSLSDDYQFKGMNIIRFHIKQEQQYQKSERDEMINGHINLGMAHGIMGALIVLAKAYKLGIFQRRDTILKLYHIYKKFEKRNGEILRYPRRLSVEKYNEGKWNDLNMNCGWCYGNISIVRGMMKVSSYMNWEDEYKFYAARLVNIINQSLKKYNLCSPIICHGYASVVTIQIASYLETNNSQYIYKLKRNIDMLYKAHNNECLKNKMYIDNIAFLSGSGGVIMTLNAGGNMKMYYSELLLMD